MSILCDKNLCWNKFKRQKPKLTKCLRNTENSSAQQSNAIEGKTYIPPGYPADEKMITHPPNIGFVS